MGAYCTKPIVVGDVQLIRLHYKDGDPITTKAPAEYRGLEGAIRSLIDIPQSERISISTKLEVLGAKITELDPETWDVLRPHISDLWISTRPLVNFPDVSQSPNHSIVHPCNAVGLAATKHSSGGNKQSNGKRERGSN
ncbi:hypothetical protein FRC14_007940 [Serendipita sp. 396]|nr:hypothetical protein FRC14_007940 [Serendipita sp. 396]KAG8864174.1 hypothetical protein FRC20_010324 [Serendipita sp. 405]